MTGNLDAVISEIKSGGDVNARNKNGTTCLMYAKTAAFGDGDLRIMEILVQQGAKINAIDNMEKNALDYAIENADKVIGFLKGNSK
ncbi:MAG: ankyrin repeat domain-containing protein [Robiginitomaculum sp.]|nr:ankyrin repeat domain-containing protein [Robiginitomaculum sp.]